MSLWPNILFRIFHRCSVCWCKAIKWRATKCWLFLRPTNLSITPICHLFGIHNIIGTQLETGEDGRYTGNYVGTPSLKEGKITRLNQWLAERGETFESYGKVYFYSDSKNDLPLLRIVDEPVAVNPDAELEKEAKAKGWPILNFK